jgi:hypothetical protein
MSYPSLSLPPVTVRLDHRRLAQLKNIAEAEGRTSTGVIAALIREKIATGVIPSDIPGIAIDRHGDELSLQIDGGKVIKMTTRHAAALVSTIRGVVNKGHRATSDMDFDFIVARIGSGISIQMPIGGEKHSFPPDLVADLADLIEKRAA